MRRNSKPLTTARRWLALTLMLFAGLAVQLQAQSYDTLLKDGHVIDPKNGIDQVMDVAILDGRIARVASQIPDNQAEEVIDVSGMIVSPGLIDLHGHLFHLEVTRAVFPDIFTFRNGITTIVDGGTSGWRNFPLFKEQTIDNSRTRVLAFLSIVGVGSSYKNDLGVSQSRIATQDHYDMNPVLTAMRVEEYPGIIVGVKAQHYKGPDYTPELRAVEAGEIAGVPVMVDFGEHRPMRSLDKLLNEILRPGDMFSHTFSNTGGRETVVDENRQVRPFVKEAQDRGILFNVGHGGGSFIWWQVVAAAEQGFWPDIIDTDTHTSSMNGGMKDMNNLMSKYLTVGMSIPDIISRTTWIPARSIQREDLGHLTEGAVADIAVFSIREGEFGFIDSRGRVMEGTRKFESELTLKDGRVMWDLNGVSARPWDENNENY
ncbi:MAG: amidohydrolase/deacetylase family metallohydrolase [Balneolaceae bacterium]